MDSGPYRESLMWHSIRRPAKAHGGTTAAWQSPRTLITSTGCFPARLNRIESGRRKKVAQLRAGLAAGGRAVELVAGRCLNGLLRWTRTAKRLSRSAESTSLAAMIRRSGDATKPCMSRLLGPALSTRSILPVPHFEQDVSENGSDVVFRDSSSHSSRPCVHHR